MEVRFREVYMVDFGTESVGSEQHGIRPAVIVSNNVGNIHSTTVLAIPITSRQKSKLPTHVKIPVGVAGLYKASTVLCENMANISKERIREYIGKMPKYFMKQIAIASTLATSMISYLDLTELCAVYERCKGLNKWEEKSE